MTNETNLFCLIRKDTITSKWAIVVLRQLSNFTAMSYREQVNFQ